MIPETFAAKWFAIYYLVLGLLLIGLGIFWLTNPGRFKSYLLERAGEEQPPMLLRKALKYFLLFTIPCIILSLSPFSWIELLFSLWSLWLVYIVGIQLVRWPQTRKIIQEKQGDLGFGIRALGAITLSVGLIILLLGYLVINRSIFT